MTIRNFEQHLPPHEVTKGKDYFKRKRVSRLTETSGRWTADVRGRDSNEYEVEVDTSDHSIDKVYCGCPIQEEKIYCKHVIAVLHAIREKLGFAVTEKEEKPAAAKQDQGLPFEQYASEALKEKVDAAIKIKAHAEARRLVEEAIQQAMDRDDTEEAYDLHKYQLSVMQRGTDIIGLRDFARKMYRETRDMDFYGYLKATYLRADWEPVIKKHIARLEEKIPLYLSGEANPAELADVYLEEFEDGDKLIALMHQVPRLSFINLYAGCLGEGYSPELLGIYRKVLLQELKGRQPNEEQAEAIKNMEALEGGEMVIHELTGDNSGGVTGPIPEYKVPRYVWEADALLAKARAAIAAELYQLAACMLQAVVEMKITITGRMKYEHSEFCHRISQGFELLATICKKPAPQPLKDQLYSLARKKVLDPKYELANLDYHWIDILLTLPSSHDNQEELRRIIDALLQKEYSTRLSRLREDYLRK